jgi:T5SS/PEP-CTERM-associated repeat protein/autotransporter-associated beta strand protein
MSGKVTLTSFLAAIPLVVLMALALACTASRGHAAITWTGNVYPANPTTWASSTLGYVGQNSAGTLTVNGGSVLRCHIGYLGCNPGSNGTATVTGTGSMWTSDRLNVGYYLGSGTLSVAEGGVVTTGTLYASLSNLSGNGTITTKGAVLDADIVFDTHSGTQPAVAFGTGGTLNLNVDGTVELGTGYRGVGTIRINEGVAVAASSGYLGYELGSAGTATVAGAGSRWTNSYDLYVGYSGSGTLNVGSGDTPGGVLAARTLSIGYFGGASGTCSIDNGGTLQAQTIKGGKGTVNLNWNNGTIQNYDGNTDLTIASFNTTLKLGATGTHTFNIDAGRTGTVNAILSDRTSDGSLKKIGAGMLLLTNANTYSGETTIEEGRFKVTGSILNTSGVTVNDSAIFELARASGNATASTLAIDNDGTVLISAGSQKVGSITGTGITQVNSGASLTAHSIVQDSLVIGAKGVQAVPEPSTIALLLTAALGGLLWWRRRS